MQKLLAELSSRFPELCFCAAHQFCWSPETGEIFYNRAATGEQDQWSLLHETGHALLGHTSYKSDFELVRLEVDAWQRARELAEELGLQIDEDHIEDCLDTYRDWLYQRSICPTCHTKSLQLDDCEHYRCFNCRTTWRVSRSRFARSYRSTKTAQAPTLFRAALNNSNQ